MTNMNLSIRKLFLCLLLAFVPGAVLFAQEDHQWAKQDVLSEPSRWGGTFGLYPEGQPLPGEEELERNPRSKSAKLRVFEKRMRD